MRLKQISKRSLAIILSVLMVFSTLMVGTISTANAATNVTLYFCPGQFWSDYANKTIKLNKNSGAGWGQYNMTNTGKTYNGYAVYSVTYSETAANYYDIQFQKYNGGTWEAQQQPISNKETAVSSINNKLWNGSSWVAFGGTTTDPTDPTTPTTPSGADIIAGTTIYFDNTEAKWNEVYIYLWNNGSNASTNETGSLLMSKVEGTEKIYYYTFKKDYSGEFILKNVSGTSGELTDKLAASNVTNGKNMVVSNVGFSNGKRNVSWSTYTPPATEVVITVEQPTGGTVMVDGTSSSTVSVTSGADVVLTATPATGYAFSYFTVNGTKIDGLASGYTTTFVAASTVSAVFEKIDETTYRISDDGKEGVTLTYTTSATPGSNVVVEVSVASGYICSIVYVNGTVLNISNGKVNFTMPAANVKLSTNVTPADMPTPWKYYGSVQNGEGIANYSPYNMIKGSLNGKEFAYVYIDDNQFFNKNITFHIADDTTTYTLKSNYAVFPQNFGGSDIMIQDWGGSAKIYTGNPYYLVVFYKNTDYGEWNGNKINNNKSHPIVAAFSELPGDSHVGKFTVSIEQGVNDYALNQAKGKSYLETKDTSHKFEYDHRTVSFSTDTTLVAGNTNVYQGVLTTENMYIHKVYGYSILVTYANTVDGKNQEVFSVTGDAISKTKNGSYAASFTFEDSEKYGTVKSATITPIFVSSDEYAKLKGITFTTLYVKATPGSNLFDSVMEPKYYTWREVQYESGKTHTTIKREDGSILQTLPEGHYGTYGGQKMLYVGNNMYMALIESEVIGVLFGKGTDGSTQTFDYKEFLKLQKLGYKEITFEPKEGISGDSVAKQLEGEYGLENKTYTRNTTDCSDFIDSALTKTNFELDVNIEGYYVDVFGNKLSVIDPNTNKEVNFDKEEHFDYIIANKDKYAKLCECTITNKADINTSVEITALLDRMGILRDANKEQVLYGARFGTVNEDKYYGMTFATHVYYFENTYNASLGKNRTYMVSQQVSGYGTIEGAQSPLDNTVTNAVAHKNKFGTNMQYATGENPTAADGTFVTGYELIDDDFKNVPYLVSYQYKDGIRIDGKWYYQSETPKIPYTIKEGLVGDDGKIITAKDDFGNNVIVQNDTGGTGAFHDGSDAISVDQGTVITAIATAKPGYKFVGFYDPYANRLSSSNNYEITVTSRGTVYAVFEKIASSTVIVTNDLYRGSNPQNGGGNGTYSVSLYVYSDANKSNPVVATGKNSASLTVADGEYFQWVITGKALGVDTFAGFRTPDKDSGYYELLDVPYDEEWGYGLQYDESTNTYSFTSAMMCMNWKNYGSPETLNIVNVTDFNKTSYIVDLHYVYRDRYEQDKTYIVKGIELTTDEMLNGYKPSDTTIEKYAPYIDEVFKNCTWDVDDDRSNVSQTGAVYTLKAKQEYKNFWTYVDYGNEEHDRSHSPFNSTVTLNAPHTRVTKDSNGKEVVENFLYWKQYKSNEQGDIVDSEADVNILSYYPRTTVRVTFDSFIVAEYGVNNAPDFGTSVKDPVYTREQYTVDDTNFDYVYADLLLQYEVSQIFSNGKTFKEFYDANNIKFGFILENDVAAKPYDGQDSPVGPSVSADYANTYNTNLENVIKKLAQTAENTTDKKASSWSEAVKNTDDYNFYYNLYDLSNYVNDLTDLGRMDYIIRFANTEKNQGIVYNVYSYIIYNDTIYISNPKVMNIYNIGNETVVDNSTV